MNKQSLKYILYALLALLIIISLFNCFKKESIEEFRRRKKKGSKYCKKGREYRYHKGHKRWLCIRCNQDYYKHWNGKGTCKKCPDDKPHTMRNGAKGSHLCTSLENTCPSGQFLFSDGKTCVDNIYKDGYGQGGSFGYDEIDHYRSLDCSENFRGAKLQSRIAHKDSTKCDIRCDQVLPKHEYKDWNKIPPLILEKCGDRWKHPAFNNGWINLPKD